MYLFNESSREIYISGDIGQSADEISASNIRLALSKLGRGDISVKVNSYGGSVDQGLEIYEMLRNHNGRITTEIEGGLAASIASVIYLAGEKRRMSPSSSLMIHNPWGFAMGDADEFDKTAEVLRMYTSRIVGVYSERTLMDESEVRPAMKVETWMTATHAVEYGFANELIGVDSNSQLSKMRAKMTECQVRSGWPSVREKQKVAMKRHEAELRSEYQKKMVGKSLDIVEKKFSKSPRMVAAHLQILRHKLNGHCLYGTKWEPLSGK